MHTRSLYLLFASFIIGLVLTANARETKNRRVDDNFMFAQKQLELALKAIGDPDGLPRTVDKNGTVVLTSSSDWTSGFFPGCLWYVYEYTGKRKWQDAAERFTKKLEKEQLNTDTHDVGFMIYNSYGHGYRLTREPGYRAVVIQAAKSLTRRFHPKTGCIQSWNSSRKWDYPVIIDNMMNLELLFQATKFTGDSSFYQIAVTHANTTLKHHFRPDYSTYHVLDYDTLTGAVRAKNTHQGYADESTWARGQSWGFYGFTLCYRETGDSTYLAQARKMADFILDHKNLPADKVPYWDYDAPMIPNEPRDASAAAILCSALYELSTYVSDGSRYKAAADRILESLSSSAYRAPVGGNGHFLLMHSVGSKPANSEVDVPLVYADYYFLEANLRKLKLERGEKLF